MTDETKREGRLPSDEELARMTPAGAASRELRVGLFVLAGIAAVLLILFLMTDPATFRGRYQIVTVVENAGGVRNGDPVQMRGVNIGRVRGFQLTPEGVVIGLEIEGLWTIPEDSRARLVSGGLLGGRTVDVVPGSSPRRAGRGAVIPGELVLSAMESVDDLGADVQGVLERVQALLSESTVASIQGGAGEMEGLLRELREVVAGQRNELRSLTATLNRTAAELEETISGSAPPLQATLARADSAMARLTRTSEALDGAVASLRSVLERMDRGEGTLGRLSTDPTLYENLARASGSLAELATDLRENPGRYIRLRFF